MAKEFTVIRTNHRNNRSQEYYGTVKELIKTFNYILETGKSYQHEKGNKKINTNPRGIKNLITNLNNAANNSAANGYSNTSYSLGE